jgi:hypothetical protein
VAEKSLDGGMRVAIVNINSLGETKKALPKQKAISLFLRKKT